MGFIDDLQKAGNMFNEGVQQLALTHGLNQANQQMQQINQAGLDELQKRQAQQQLGNQLAQQLMGAGVGADKIQNAMSLFAPPSVKNAEDANLQGLMTGSSQLQGVAKEQQAFENKPKLEQLEVAGNIDIRKELIKGQKDQDRQILKLEKDDRNAINKNVAAFNSATKDSLVTLNKVKSAKMILNDPENGAAKAAARSLLLRASGQVGNYSDWEQQILQTPGLVESAKRLYDKQVNGSPFTKADIEAYKSLAEIYERNATNFIHNEARRRADQTNQVLGTKLTDDEIFEKFMPKSAQEQLAPKQALPKGLPPGSVDNGDGTFSAPNGKKYRIKAK